MLVLQGGGALDACQAGVFEAFDEIGISPDWVIGPSIGAIDAALIAGNIHENRLPRLKAFYDPVTHEPAERRPAFPGGERSSIEPDPARRGSRGL